MRKLLTAVSFAALAVAGIGIASAQSDVGISEAQVADIRIDFPVYPIGQRTGVLINKPDPKGDSPTFEWPN